MKFSATFLLCFFVIGLSIFGCEKETVTVIETETVTETITVTDTIIQTVTDTIFLTTNVNATRFVLVRHAEILEGDNPNLSEAGIARAENLADILSDVELERVYSTPYKRTLQTATPTAENQGLSITNYEGFDHEEVIEDILENIPKSNILIVGHTSTTPNFLNTLTGTTEYTSIPEKEYDNIYIVDARSLGDVDVLELKY